MVFSIISSIISLLCCATYIVADSSPVAEKRLEELKSRIGASQETMHVEVENEERISNLPGSKHADELNQMNTGTQELVEEQERMPENASTAISRMGDKPKPAVAQ